LKYFVKNILWNFKTHDMKHSELAGGGGSGYGQAAEKMEVRTDSDWLLVDWKKKLAGHVAIG